MEPTGLKGFKNISNRKDKSGIFRKRNIREDGIMANRGFEMYQGREAGLLLTH